MHDIVSALEREKIIEIFKLTQDDFQGVLSQTLLPQAQRSEAQGSGSEDSQSRTGLFHPSTPFQVLGTAGTAEAQGPDL